MDQREASVHLTDSSATRRSPSKPVDLPVDETITSKGDVNLTPPRPGTTSATPVAPTTPLGIVVSSRLR